MKKRATKKEMNDLIKHVFGYDVDYEEKEITGKEIDDAFAFLSQNPTQLNAKKVLDIWDLYKRQKILKSKKSDIDSRVV